MARFVSKRLVRWLAVLACVGAALWVAFFDSHSLANRVGWHQEHEQLAEENAALRRDIEALQEKVSAPPSDAVIEKIAREQYGMRRPGETVYRVER